MRSLDKEMLFVLTRHPALIEPAEKRRAHLGENPVADVGQESGAYAQKDFEKTESWQTVDKFANGRAAHEKILAAIGAPFHQHDRFHMRDFGVNNCDLLESRALLGAETHAARMIGRTNAVDPAVAERALAIEEKERRMLLGGQGKKGHAGDGHFYRPVVKVPVMIWSMKPCST